MSSATVTIVSLNCAGGVLVNKNVVYNYSHVLGWKRIVDSKTIDFEIDFEM